MRTLLVAPLLALALLSPASANHCTMWTTSTTELLCQPTPALGGYYVDEDCGSDPYSIWVYEESNGLPGLQRHDEVVDDTCGMIRGDTIIL